MLWFLSLARFSRQFKYLRVRPKPIGPRVGFRPFPETLEKAGKACQ